MTPLEKAARAACVAAGHDPNVTFDVCTGDPADSYSWGGYRNIARAVLLAVREPGEDVLVAVFEAADDLPEMGPSGVWEAGIDAILNDPKAP